MAFFRFVRTAPRGVLGSWVQGGFRVIQWDLPAVTEDWQSADTFTVLCTVPDDATSETRRRLACRMFAWRILSLLRWFGLHDYRRPQETLDVVWRMSALFDRFVWLEVTYSDSPRSGPLTGRRRAGSRELFGVLLRRQSACRYFDCTEYRRTKHRHPTTNKRGRASMTSRQVSPRCRRSWRFGMERNSAVGADSDQSPPLDCRF